ncbi:MAG: PEGA domain-containing protein [Candidatus Eremiobacteraeota bacterium]|nr:PEGA domain-containing protein [Candidatus Eremiobacteraeota bacterium]
MRASLPALVFAVTLLGGLGTLASAFEPKPSEQVGLLSIVSEPAGAQVLLDGKPLGKTPLSQAPIAGSHRLTFRLDGYAEAERTLESGQRIHQRLQPLNANLTVKDLDKAKLRLGPGVPRELEGKGPWKLAPGQYELTAVRDKIPARPKRFELKPGQSLEIALDWPSLPAMPPVPVAPPAALPAAVRLPQAPPLNLPTYVIPAPPRPRYNYYTPPRPAYRPPVRQPDPIFTPLPPTRFEPPAPPPSYPAGPEPVFTPLP